MDYYLGIDGGGSKTACVVGDGTSVLASAESGPSNITRVGEARARTSIHEAIRLACASAKVDPAQISAACFGAAGAARENVAAQIHQIAAEMLRCEINVVGDMSIALEAAFGSGPGIIVIAGTGSIAFARNVRGETARAGGWGFAVSDEGSAHWIGRSAVSALLHEIDSSVIPAGNAQAAAESIPLFHAFAKVWTTSSLDDFVRKANANPDFAELFPAIASASDKGEVIAQQILPSAGSSLAQLVCTVRPIFDRDQPPLATIRLAVAGGVFRHSSHVREVFGDKIRNFEPRVVANLEVVEPVMGALQMARKAQAR